MNKLFVAILVITFACAFSTMDLDAWNEFKVRLEIRKQFLQRKLIFCAFQLRYSKQYQNETEEAYRMNIFLEHKKRIDEHNEKFEKGLVSFKMGINIYSDLTSEEFGSRMHGFKQTQITD